MYKMISDTHHLMVLSAVQNVAVTANQLYLKQQKKCFFKGKNRQNFSVEETNFHGRCQGIGGTLLLKFPEVVSDRDRSQERGAMIPWDREATCPGVFPPWTGSRVGFEA